MRRISASAVKPFVFFFSLNYSSSVLSETHCERRIKKERKALLIAVSVPSVKSSLFTKDLHTQQETRDARGLKLEFK